MWISSFKAPSMKAAFSQCRLLTLSSKVSDIKNIFKYYPGGFSSVSQNYCAGHILWFLFHCKTLPCVAHFLGQCDKCQCEQKSIYPTWGNRDPTKVGCAESEFIGVICRGMGEACGTAGITDHGGHASKLEAWRSLHHLQAVWEVECASLLGLRTEGKEETLYSLKYSTLFILY